MGRTGGQFRNAVICTLEAQCFGKFICESHIRLVEMIGAAERHDGDLRPLVRLGSLAFSQPEVLVEASTFNDLLPPPKIQLINK